MNGNLVDLSGLLSSGGSWHNIPGKDAGDFITSALLAMSEPGKPDRRFLAEAMITRETVSPTAMGDGLAFPHPLAYGLGMVGASFMAVGYPRFPVPWSAPDRIPVRAAFFIVCSDRNYHLLALSALAKQCSRSEVRLALMDEAPVSILIELMQTRVVHSNLSCT